MNVLFVILYKSQTRGTCLLINVERETYIIYMRLRNATFMTTIKRWENAKTVRLHHEKYKKSTITSFSIRPDRVVVYIMF